MDLNNCPVSRIQINDLHGQMCFLKFLELAVHTTCMTLLTRNHLQGQGEAFHDRLKIQESKEIIEQKAKGYCTFGRDILHVNLNPTQ